MNATVPDGLLNAEQTLALLIRKYGDEADAAALVMLAANPRPERSAKPAYKYILAASVVPGRSDYLLDVDTSRVCKTLKRARRLRDKLNKSEGGGNCWQIYKLVDFLPE